jgi:hypothetical protein
MRPRLRPLRELVQDLHLSPEERHIALAEECLETLFDPGRCACADLGEREEAALEAERRRWCGPDPEPERGAQGSNATTTRSSTGTNPSRA